MAEDTRGCRSSLRDPKARKQVSRAGRGWGGPAAPVLRVSAGTYPESVPRWTEAPNLQGGAGGWDENGRMCVLTPKGTGPLAPTAGERGAAGVRKKRRARGSGAMCGWWGGQIGSPSRCGSLSGFYLPTPWIPQTQVFSPQPPLSSTHGDPQAILFPSCEDSYSLTLLPIWDTSRESSRQTRPCPQPRDCLEGKEESPITRGSQSI